jgi:hypothetical protein
VRISSESFSSVEESEQAEHDIAIRAGVGHDLHGLKFVCCSSSTASKTKLSRNAPGTGIAFNPVN